MPTFPTLFDEVLQLQILKLNEWNYLKGNQRKSGTLIWASNGRETGSISIQVNTKDADPYIQLDYNFKDQPRNYKIPLVSVPSKLGRGLFCISFAHTQTNFAVNYIP